MERLGSKGVVAKLKLNLITIMDNYSLNKPWQNR